MGSSSSCTNVEESGEPLIIPYEEPRKILSSTAKSSLSSGLHVQNNLNQGDIYSRIWDKNNQLSSEFESLKTTKKTIKIKAHEKVTRDSKWPLEQPKSLVSSEEDSAEVNAMIDGEVHECINFSSSEDIEAILKRLNSINIQIDEEVERRIKVITAEEQRVIIQILEEKETSEEVILKKTKLEQEDQEKRYQKLLEEYIIKLQKEKLEYLCKLYEKLKKERLSILQRSESNITKATKQARQTKLQILQQVQKEAAAKIEDILAELRRYSNDTSHQSIGGEELTKINMKIFSKFGTKSEGQHCQNIDQKDPFVSNNTQIKRTTYIKPTTN